MKWSEMKWIDEQSKCAHCNSSFTKQRAWSRFCSTNCRVLSAYHQRKHPTPTELRVAQAKANLRWAKWRGHATREELEALKAVIAEGRKRCLSEGTEPSLSLSVAREGGA
jgi:hypothetical protein